MASWSTALRLPASEFNVRLARCAPRRGGTATIQTQAASLKGETLMKLKKLFAIPLVALIMTTAAYAAPVSVDYDHSINFSQPKTYSW
jgi:hypothetical protein